MVDLNYREAVAYVDRHAGRGVKPGLDRIKASLDAMGNPETSYPIVHVAGTNGKTSTAHMISALAAAHELTVGTHTSPHLEKIDERFVYDGRVISQDEFAQAVGDVAAFDQLFDDDPDRRLTYFEFTTAVALAWFAERAVELAVVEVGLGGRLDATNVLEAEVSVVTSIGLEHTDYLGSTVAEIANEKLAILKQGGRLVTGALGPEIDGIAETTAERLDANYQRLGRDFKVGEAERAVGGWAIEVDGIYETYPEIYLPLHGRHQIDNFAISVAAMEELIGRPLDPAAVQEAAAGLSLAGRLEVTGHNPLVVLDGAHNPASMAALAHAVDEEFPPFLWKTVIGVMGDKDLEPMLESLKPIVGEVFAVSADYERARPAGEVAALATKLLPDTPVHVCGGVPDGVRAALEAAGNDGAILVTGSLYVVGEARSLIATEKGAEGGG